MARILVTGASGLLGTAVVERLSRDNDVFGLSRTMRLPGTCCLDLLDGAALETLNDEPWNALVHCAAFRSPDYCEENREASLRLNGEVPGQLAAMALARDARMIHISTDYVFDGAHPPYSEDDPTNPVNFYGEAKLEGELSVRRVNSNAVILRVPGLWGYPPSPVESPMLVDGIRAAYSETESFQDDVIVRYPTHTQDVADVIAFLLANDYVGTLHAGAHEATTRYRWAVAVTQALGRDASHIQRMQSDPERLATRPVNSHLATDRLAALGAPLPRGFSEWLPEVLPQFM
ncbi:MAG: SDR family oxidoreductase [Kiritimatiellae bacterium]|nr:SDR family oxidoreductase [Kiritimatiellia bacterium]